MKATKQQDLILAHDGNAVVIAAPGSGKTYVISEKIKQNLKSLMEHEGVIAISYTNKASAELKTRSLSNGENPRSSFFGTIDKFNLAEIIIPFAKHLFGIPGSDIRVLKIQSLPNDEIESLNWFNRNLSLEEISESQLSEIGNYFLSGIILIETIGVFANYVFTKSLACQNYLKARYKYIYIDEYQDSGVEQHQIFLKIKNLNIKAVAVGDLNQSIYAFSGKDAKYLEELTNNTDFKYFKLDRNHRCHPSIINYSNYLLNPKTELIPVDQNLIYFYRIAGNENDIAKWLEKEIGRLQKVFGIEKRNQIAVLTRTTRTGEIIDQSLQIPHKLSTNNELDTSLNVWSAIFSNLLRFILDKEFKFIDVIEIFTTYDRFKNRDLKGLTEAKRSLELMLAKESLDNSLVIKEFVAIAQIVAPNSESSESIELLKEVQTSLPCSIRWGG